MERLYDKRPRVDRLLLRGLHFAIVDEADSVLVDEARTPLIISGAEDSDTSEQETCQTALSLAATMIMDKDFIIERHNRCTDFQPGGAYKSAAPVGNLRGGGCSPFCADDVPWPALRRYDLQRRLDQ